MRPNRVFAPGIVVLTFAVAAAVAGVGCSQKSPEERVAEIRSRYLAEVNQGGFYVEQVPVDSQEMLEEVMGEGGSAEEAGESEAVEGAEEMAGDLDAEGEGEGLAREPVRQQVVLDILVRHDSNQKLPGITVDIVQVGADDVEKGKWLLWVDTAGLEKGTIEQVRHVIEDVDYTEGDRFSVEVRHPIPAAERGEYREFSMAPLS